MESEKHIGILNCEMSANILFRLYTFEPIPTKMGQ